MARGYETQRVGSVVCIDSGTDSHFGILLLFEFLAPIEQLVWKSHQSLVCCAAFGRCFG